MIGEHRQDVPNPRKPRLGVGAYVLSDAALLLKIPFGKLKRWASGYWYAGDDGDRFSEPVISQGDGASDRILTFAELMELYVVASFRERGVSMPTIRAARSAAREIFGSEHPFATEVLETDGKGIFARIPVHGDRSVLERLTIELSKGQAAFEEIVRPFFRGRLDYESGTAFRYWPMGRENVVLLDAHRAFGQPIIGRSGVPTYVLYEMHRAGESVRKIAAWYEVDVSDVDAAITFETSLRTAA